MSPSGRDSGGVAASCSSGERSSECSGYSANFAHRLAAAFALARFQRMFEYVPTALATVAIGMLVSRRSCLVGTTLVASWWWLFVSMSFVAAVQLLITARLIGSTDSAAWRFLAATSTLCPGIALIGAKRPQYSGWQWIVASLWLILSLPAIQLLVMQKGAGLQVHSVRLWFMNGILLFCFLNSVFSRYCFAAILAGVAQILLFAPQYGFENVSEESSLAWSVMLLSVAILLTSVRIGSKPSFQSLDQLWLDFRNRFGLVWSLRVMESVNTTAATNAWNVRLTWSGFRDMTGQGAAQMSSEEEKRVRQTLQNLLRRFVSRDSLRDRSESDSE